MLDATLRLFSAIQTTRKTPTSYNADMLKHMLANGYLVEPVVEIDMSYLRILDAMIGVGGAKLNQTFHKSWEKVATASIQQLIVEQMLHYFTTYGLESIGNYDGRFVYVPTETLDVPGLTDSMPIMVIRVLKKYEILERIIALDNSGIALSRQTLTDIMTIVKANEYKSDWVEGIKNRELAGLLAEYYNLPPTEPEAWLRYVLAKLIKSPMIIKDKKTLESITKANGGTLDELLKTAPENLGEIFLRHKPIFLAMKKISRNKHFFNQLRKAAVYQHKPVFDYMNSITAQIKAGKFDLKKLEQRLPEYSIWRKIRLAYALRLRLEYLGTALYRVRNGKGWITDKKDYLPLDTLRAAFDAVILSIASQLNVEGMRIYIPAGVNYALPSSEKQFVGNLPGNTSFTIPRNDLVVGVHWYDNGIDRVDLDLALLARTKIGWNGYYRHNGILFSGDMTSAPDGAAEAFYFPSMTNETYLMTLNWFNKSGERVERASIFAAQGKSGFKSQGYMVDQNKLLFSQPLDVSEKQNIVGLVRADEKNVTLQILATSVGKSISSAPGGQLEKVRAHMISAANATISLNEILELAGAVMVDEPDAECLNLSPESLTKDTIIKLLTA